LSDQEWAQVEARDRQSITKQVAERRTRRAQVGMDAPAEQPVRRQRKPSGAVKLQLRMPTDLHDRLHSSADRHNQSLNSRIVAILTDCLDADEREARAEAERLRRRERKYRSNATD